MNDARTPPSSPTPAGRDTTASVRAFRGTFLLGGSVATIAGLDGLLRGARAVPGVSEQADPVLESELRFYSAFYAAYGLLMLSVAPRTERDSAAVTALSAALLLAGLGRVAGWVSVGKPNRFQRALLAVELGAPVVITAWRARLTA